MIGAKQINNMFNYIAAASSSEVVPTANLSFTYPSYPESAVPGTNVLSGNIVSNGAKVQGWVLKDNGNNQVAIGSGTSAVNYSLATIPSVVGSYTYSLVITYYNEKDITTTATETITLQVVEDCLVGQLPNPGDNITIPGDFTPTMEAALVSQTQIGLINPFNITAAGTGRIVFVIPDSYGVVDRIEDNIEADITDEFNIVNDPGNGRKFYVGINTVVSGTYNYKFVFVN